MKKLYFLLLFPVFLQAQIVNIPDANFKAVLVSAGVDTSGDGNIQLSEAQAITNLDIYELSGYPIYSVEGIESFTNIAQLSMMLPHVQSVTLTGFNALQGVVFSGNYSILTSLHLAQLPALDSVFIDTAPDLSDLVITDCPVMTVLHTQQTPALGTLDLTGCALLDTVNVDGVTNVNVSGLVHLTTLYCDNSNLSTLNVSGCTALQTLSIIGSHPENLDLSGLTSLQSFTMGGFFTPPTVPMHLNASGCTSLTSLNLDDDYIGTLNLNGCSAIEFLSAGFSGLTDVDLTGCTALQWVDLAGNNLSMFDATDCHTLSHLDLYANPLQFIFIKNGSNEHLGYLGFPYPQFICMDEIDIQDFIASENPSPEDNLVCSSYCTFTPGGDYNTISGDVHYDIDGNGCDISDPAAQVQIGFNDGTTQYYTYSSNGHYTLYTGAGNIQLAGNFPPYWTAADPSPVYFSDNQNHTITQDFCLMPNGVHHDVEIYSFPAGSEFVPGFDTAYNVQVRNKGNQAESGIATLAFDPAVLSVVSAPGATVASGLVSWNFSGLLPFQRQDFQVTFHLNAPTDNPAVNIGDPLVLTASAAIASDEFPDDNMMENHEVVVGSFDPNEIFCAEGDVLPPSFIGETLHYIINFENTGTAPAGNVVAKMLIDPNQYDISTLQPMGSSHAVNTVVTGNKVEFIFENIGLGPNEYGYVAYSIKSRNTLVSGDSVSATAKIYFDFNAPVVTNTATTTFQNLGMPGNSLENRISLYPNPAAQTVSIKSPVAIAAMKIVDVQGRILKSVPAGANEVSISLDGLAPGAYMVIMDTASGSVSKKLVKS